MKKLLLFLLLLSQGLIFAQAIPNPGFESWNSTLFSDPTSWFTSNSQVIRKGFSPTVTQVTGVSGFAVRMQTATNATDTAEAYISNSMDPINGVGGQPFSQQATAITGQYRYNLPGNDTAFMLVIFKLGGNMISSDIIPIKGTGSQPTFTAFSFPVNPLVTPDTVILAAVSSNILGHVGIQNGSFLELDNLAFTGPGVTQTINDGDFENWVTSSYDTPVGWEFGGDGVFRTSNSYAGLYAVSMTTQYDNQSSSFYAGGMTSGHYTQSGQNGGQAYTGTVDTLTGYYAFSTTNMLDTGYVWVSLSKNGNPVGVGSRTMGFAMAYTYFEVPFNAGITPDTMAINFSSSKYPNVNITAGSTLTVDQLQLKSALVGIKESERTNSRSFPNPAENTLNIAMNSAYTGEVKVEVMDVSGKLVRSETAKATKGSMVISVSELQSGIYFYEIKNNGIVYKNKFIKK